MLTLIIVIALAAVANSVMDVLRFRYFESVFQVWSFRSGRWGEFWEWFSGIGSWENKYDYKGLLGYLFRGPLVAFTDLWHFAQMVMFTAYQAALVQLAPLPALIGPVADFFIYLAAAKVIHGVVFELFWKRILINPKYHERTR